MKDKLIRTNHKGIYYFFRKCGICLGCIVASSILIALPLSFGLNTISSNSNNINSKAELSHHNDVNLLKF